MVLVHSENVTEWTIGCCHSGSQFIKDFVTGLSPQERTVQNFLVKFTDLIEFVSICQVFNFHRSLSGMKQLLNRYLIRSWSWAPDLIIETVDSKKFFWFLKTHKFSRNILYSCLNARKSHGLFVASDILVTLYEWYDDCFC